jgi:hypothetical protein
LSLLTELLGSFTYGLVVVVSEICKILCKILCSDSEVTSINMGSCFEDLVIVACRFLSFVYHSRIPHVPLATSLLAIWFQATSVSLGELILMDFRAFARTLHPPPRRPIAHPVAPPPRGGERYPGAYCATDGGAAIQVLANPVNASVTIRFWNDACVNCIILGHFRLRSHRKCQQEL